MGAMRWAVAALVVLLAAPAHAVAPSIGDSEGIMGEVATLLLDEETNQPTGDAEEVVDLGEGEQAGTTPFMPEVDIKRMLSMMMNASEAENKAAQMKEAAVKKV